MIQDYANRLQNFLQSDIGKSNQLIMPDDFSWQGHRGARGLLPENTIPSFLKAQELDVHTVELDVVVSKDKQLVVSHEEWMRSDICTKPNGNFVGPKEEKRHIIYRMPYEKVRRYDCGKRGNPKFPDQQAMPAHKPLLIDVIDAMENHAEEQGFPPPIYNIEIKSNPKNYGRWQPRPKEFAQLVYDVIEKQQSMTRVISGRVILQSFDIAIVQALHKIDCFLSLSMLVDNEHSVEWHLDELGFIPDVYAPYYQLITPKMVYEVQRHGIDLYTWTVNDLPSMRYLISLGVDGIITDYPNLVSQFNYAALE